MTRDIEALEKELREVQAEIRRLCSYYNPKASRDHYAAEINKLITREHNIQINLNQERQKRR